MTPAGTAPQTTPFESTVVGIARTGDDMQSAEGEDLTDATSRRDQVVLLSPYDPLGVAGRLE